VHASSDQEPPKVLREVKISSPAPDGVWLLRYRHGLLTLIQGTNPLGSADLQLLGIPVAGVSWTQKGGEVACEGMILKGEPLREVSAADQETLQRASRLNEEAGRLLREKKFEAALAKMEEASALYVEGHGENHHDSANSFANRATILESLGRMEEAGKLWVKAVEIQEKVLGPTHPHTTLMRFNLGKNLFERGEKTKAKELWTRCRDDWKSVLGPDYPLAKSLDGILPTLQ
jgi:tetratricopeptide (TPR) repeat protein